MKKYKRSQADALAIGDRLLTLREAADVLLLSAHTLRIRQPGKRSKAESSADGRDLDGQTLTLSLQMRTVTGIFLERIITGIRRWSRENKGADGTAIAAVIRALRRNWLITSG